MRYIGFMKNNHMKPIQRRSLRDEVYETLKKAIITLELAPEQRLYDQELAEQFAVSRTPVREALKRLEDERLVESFPGSYTRVTPLNTKEAEHAFTVVAALHALAARLSCSKLQASDVEKLQRKNEELKQAIQEKDAMRAIEVDEQFHGVFLEAAGNPEISRALQAVIPKVQRLEVSQFSAEGGKQSVHQHEMIISACQNEEYEKVVQLIENNWLSLGKFMTEGR